MSIKLKGNKELIAVLKRLPVEMEKDVITVLEVNAQRIEADAKRNAPVGTPESTGIKGYVGGTLQKSIKSLRIGKLTFGIRANETGLAPYAAFVEFGTRFMRAQPFLFPAFFKGRNRFINDLQDLLNRKLNKI